MTFEEIVAHYAAQPWSAGRAVERRSAIDNTDVRLGRRATCICGHCGDSFACACGRDRVGHGQDCWTCGRPWWCER